MMYVRTEDLVQHGGDLSHISGGLNQSIPNGAAMKGVQEMTVRGEMGKLGSTFTAFAHWANNTSMDSLHTLHLNPSSMYDDVGDEEDVIAGLDRIPFHQFTSLRHVEVQMEVKWMEWEWLDPLFTLTPLENLTVNARQATVIGLTNESIRQLAEGLPNLLHLELSLVGDDLTAHCFRHLARHCSSLVSLIGLELGGPYDDYWSDDSDELEIGGEGQLGQRDQSEFEEPQEHNMEVDAGRLVGGGGEVAGHWVQVPGEEKPRHRLRILDIPKWDPKEDEFWWVQDLFPFARTHTGSAPAFLPFPLRQRVSHWPRPPGIWGFRA